ncbi:hypothetical protein H310_09116 [Aphanomyces invadans]|uniref:Uncharacterized protein n=1 Tax=Aphanomyces invadans TaxID=157072 RepID=A0A024TUA7_9STRA|nr:hypothetical protein H310_09116 [Aphanomyces invadans]ETV97755.1 hypothetical protein H310_09116 [Aphanomyces invadans]|eukprot:XP_008873316.1 hypothetical protein H310_09116 [Aphanomyces invadans]
MLAEMNQHQHGHKRLLNILLLGNGALAAGILLNSIFVLGDSGGLNEFICGAMFLSYSFAAILMLNRNPSAFSIGMLMGSSVVLAALAFLNALYWLVASATMEDHTVAAGFAGAFNLIYFVVDATFVSILYRSKHDIIETYSAYDYIPDKHEEVADVATTSCSHCEGDDTFSVCSYQSSAQAPLPTADI